MEVDMNPDLNSPHTNHNYVPSWENSLYQDPTTATVRKKSLKNLKVEHYLRLLNGNGMQWPMIEHISEFFWSLVRRNLSIGSITQYFHGLNRFFLFLISLDINREINSKAFWPLVLRESTLRTLYHRIL